jgi:hypothetical protein
VKACRKDVTGGVSILAFMSRRPEALWLTKELMAPRDRSETIKEFHHGKT